MVDAAATGNAGVSRGRTGQSGQVQPFRGRGGRGRGAVNQPTRLTEETVVSRLGCRKDTRCPEQRSRGGGGTANRAVRDVNCKCSACEIRGRNPASVPTWGDQAPAKQHLRLILTGDHTHRYWNDPPGTVYDSNRQLFHLYKYERFRTNLNTLKKSIKADRERLQFDEQAVMEELAAFPRPERTTQGNIFYDTSKTKQKLAEHALDGTLERFKGKPRELKTTCPEYDEFEDKEFRKHVNNTRQRHLGSVGWQFRRNLEGSKDHHAKYA